MLSYGIIDYMGAVLARKESTVRITLWYFIISSIIMAVIGLLFIKAPSIPLIYLPVFAVLSALSVFALISFLKGLRVGNISVVSPIASAYPIIIVLTGVFLLKETVTLLLGSGIVLIILGTVLTSFKINDMKRLKIGKMLPGVKYAIMTLLGWGVLYAAVGVISKSLGWFYPVFIIAVGSAIILFLYSEAVKIKISFPKKISWLLLIYIAIGIAAFLFYSIGTDHGSIVVVGPISGAAPLVTVILAVGLARERINANQAIGIAFIIIGIIVLAL